MVKHSIGKFNPTFLTTKGGSNHLRILGASGGAQWREENRMGKQCRELDPIVI